MHDTYWQNVYYYYIAFITSTYEQVYKTNVKHRFDTGGTIVLYDIRTSDFPWVFEEG